MYQLEMHLHTAGRSNCAETDVKTIAQVYHEHGYDGIVCTDHFIRHICEHEYKKGSPRLNAEFFVDGYASLKKECEKYGIDVFFGMELNTDALTYYKECPPMAELLIYGISPEWVLAHPYDLFPLSLKELSLLCKEKGWILAQSHPYRDRIEVQDCALLEGVEVYNGHPHQNSRNEKALALAEKHNLLMTAGSDFHTPDAVGSGVLLQNPVKTNEELVAELRKRTHMIMKRPNAKD